MSVTQAASRDSDGRSGSDKWARQLDSLLSRAVGQDDIYIALALHPFLDAAGRAALEDVLFATGKRRRKIASAAYAPTSVLRRMAQLTTEPGIKARLVRNRSTPIESLRELAGDNGSTSIMAAVAAHEDATEDLLTKLNWRDAPAVRKSLCGNPKTGRETLDSIATDAPLELRKLIARHPNAAPGILDKLWAHSDRYLRGEVVANANCPADIQDEAEKHEDDFLRRMLASEKPRSANSCMPASSSRSLVSFVSRVFVVMGRSPLKHLLRTDDSNSCFNRL